MDEPEGFFPERRLLAYRRSLLTAEPVPAAAATRNNSAWWLLLLCFGPSYFAIGVSMYPREAPGGHLLPILIFGSYFLAACAVLIAALGACLGIYRGK